MPDLKKLPILGFCISLLQGNDMDYGTHVAIIGLTILYIAFSLSETLVGTSFSFFFNLAPIWLPWIIFLIFLYRWTEYIGKHFRISLGRTTFRLVLPQEVLKSPQAMEFVLHQIWNKQTVDNLWQAYIDGKQPSQYGLEIVSIGGEVRFYMNLYVKKAVEQFLPAIYSQYPGVEVIEEPVDYTAEIPLGDPDWELFSTHLGKKDPDYSLINTYIDFGLDDMPDEDEKLDPLTPLLEQLASIKPTERVYIQLIVKSFRTKSFAQGNFFNLSETPNWNKLALAKVNDMMQRDPDTKAPKNSDESDFEGSPRVTPGERADIEAFERNATKYAYTVGIRLMYMAKKGHFRGSMLNPLNRTLSQWDNIGRGAIGARWRTDFNYMWFSDPFGDRLRAAKRSEHKELKLRKYIPKSQTDAPKIFTTEEIASIFHLPGKVALTPTLERVPSTRGQAPSNLPTGEPPKL